MKKFFNSNKRLKSIIVLSLCFMLCVCGLVGMSLARTAPVTVGAETTTQPTVNKITVSGLGEVKLAPDMAIISIGVESLNESLSVAQKENSDNINKLIETLKEMGISEENIKTRNFYVYQRYDYSKGEEFLGYQVSNYLDFKTKDVDNVGSIISKLLENGANRLSGVSFTIENQDEAYNMALARALENAKIKAKALTDMEYKNFEICESESYNCIAREYYSSYSKDSNVVKGEICIKANIKVIFEY